MIYSQGDSLKNLRDIAQMMIMYIREFSDKKQAAEERNRLPKDYYFFKSVYSIST